MSEIRITPECEQAILAHHLAAHDVACCAYGWLGAKKLTAENPDEFGKHFQWYKDEMIKALQLWDESGKAKNAAIRALDPASTRNHT